LNGKALKRKRKLRNCVTFVAMGRYMVECDIHLLHVGTWVCCLKSFSIAKSETSLLCGMFIVSVDIRLGVQRKYIKESPCLV